MSDSQAYEEIQVSSDGISVTKRFEEDEFPVPAIAFEFSSHRDEDVTVRLSDSVPEQVAVEDLGFHPEYGSEFWTIDDETITFERALDANAEYTTVYGIRATGSDDVEKFLTEPTIEEVDPPLPNNAAGSEDIVPESGDDIVKDVIAGDGEVPGLEDDEDGTAPDEEVETLDLKDPNQSERAAQSGDGDGGTAEAKGGDSVSSTVNVVQAMANEIRQKNVSAEDIQLLRQAFDVATEDGSTSAKVTQLQSDISDLRAYTSALEEFLDENGTAEEVIEDFRAQLDGFDDRLADFESQLSGHGDQLDSVTSEVKSVSNEVDSMSTDVDEMGEDVDTVSDGLEQVQDAISEIEEDIEGIESNMVEDDVAERMDSIEEDIEALVDWQEQIKSTFG